MPAVHADVRPGDKAARLALAINKAPQQWLILEDDVRRCLTRIFPYAIPYSIESDYLLIIAVVHCHRELGYWRHRGGGNM